MIKKIILKKVGQQTLFHVGAVLGSWIQNQASGIDKNPVLRIRIRDPGLGAFLTPGSGMGESQHPDPGWRQFGSGIEKSRIRDPG